MYFTTLDIPLQIQQKHQHQVTDTNHAAHSQ